MTDAAAPKFKHLPSSCAKQFAEYAHRTHYFNIPPGVTVDDLLRADFWAFHANEFQRRDTIEAVAEDGSFDVLLRVEDVGVNAATVYILRETKNPEAVARSEREAQARADAQTTGKAVDKKYPCVDYKKATRWRVLGHVGETIKDGFATQAEAQAVLDDYVKRFGAKAA